MRATGAEIEEFVALMHDPDVARELRKMYWLTSADVQYFCDALKSQGASLWSVMRGAIRGLDLGEMHVLVRVMPYFEVVLKSVIASENSIAITSANNILSSGAVHKNYSPFVTDKWYRDANSGILKWEEYDRMASHFKAHMLAKVLGFTLGEESYSKFDEYERVISPLLKHEKEISEALPLVVRAGTILDSMDLFSVGDLLDLVALNKEHPDREESIVGFIKDRNGYDQKLIRESLLAPSSLGSGTL